MPKPRGKLKQTTVALGSDLRIGRAREVFDMLVTAGKSGNVLIEGGEVIRIDAAGLQAVVAAIVRFRTAGTLWRWHNLSPAFTDAAKLLGLEGALERK